MNETRFLAFPPHVVEDIEQALDELPGKIGRKVIERMRATVKVVSIPAAPQGVTPSQPRKKPANS